MKSSRFSSKLFDFHWFQMMFLWSHTLHTLGPEQNGCHFTEILKYIFWKENSDIFIEILLTVVVDNMSPLTQVIAWHWTGDKQLSEPMVTQIPLSGNSEIIWNKQWHCFLDLSTLQGLNFEWCKQWTGGKGLPLNRVLSSFTGQICIWGQLTPGSHFTKRIRLVLL